MLCNCICFERYTVLHHPEPALIWPLECACRQMRPPGVQELPLFHWHAKISTQSGSLYSARHNLCHVQIRLKDCTCPSVPEYLCPFPRALGVSGGSDGKESACNARDLGLISGSGRSPGEEGGNPLRYSCLGNPMDKAPWGATTQGVAKSQTWLSNFHHFPRALVTCGLLALKIPLLPSPGEKVLLKDWAPLLHSLAVE